VALIFILLTYGGWNEAAYLTAEIRDGRRNIVRALVIGLLIVTALYMLINAAYVQALGLAGMRASKAVAADLVKLAFGDAGKILLALVVMAAALTTLNATVFTGARTNYALGRDFALFGFLGRWHPSSNAPVAGLVWQGTIALVLVGFASMTPDGFETMVAYTAPAFWLFFLLTGISLFVLRRRAPMVADPFRVPLYPVTPVLFCCMCMYMLYSSTNYAMSLNPSSIGAQIGIVVLLVGIPLFFFAQPSAAAPVAQHPSGK
jgi:amino acid transporter